MEVLFWKEMEIYRSMYNSKLRIKKYVSVILINLKIGQCNFTWFIWVRLMYTLRAYINYLFLKIFYRELKKLSKNLIIFWLKKKSKIVYWCASHSWVKPKFFFFIRNTPILLSSETVHSILWNQRCKERWTLFHPSYKRVNILRKSS